MSGGKGEKDGLSGTVGIRVVSKGQFGLCGRDDSAE